MPFHSTLHSTQVKRSPNATIGISLTTAAFLILSALFLLQGPADAQGADGSATVPISIEPSTGLSDGQQVEIAVRPIPGLEGLSILQCKADSADPNDCMGITWLGFANQQLATASVTVWRSIDTPNGPFDCALEGCKIRGYANAYSDVPGQGDLVAQGLLTFDPGIAELARPTITVNPTEALVDGAELTITGQGFQPFARVDIRLCAAIEGTFHNDACDYRSYDSAEIDGTLNADAIFSRFIAHRGVSGGIDCAKQICTLQVRLIDLRGQGIAAAPPGRSPASRIVSFEDIPFNRELPLVTTSPRNGLIDRQIVSVDVGGDAHSHYANIVQCPTGTNDIALCAPLRSTRSDDDLSYGVSVRRVLRVGESGHGGGSVGGAPEPIDCALVPKSCTIAAVVYDGVYSLVPSARALTFDADVPPDRAVVTIESRNKIVAGETTVITVSNNANQRVEVRQCPRSATSHEGSGCIQIGRSYQPLETLSIAVRPARFLDVGTGTPIDCLIPRSCDFRVFGSDGPIRRLLINFVGDTTALPNLSLATQRNLTHGQQIDGTVLAPGMVWMIHQCVVGEPRTNHGDNCDQTGAIIQEYSFGPVDTKITVSRFVNSFDCSQQPRSCELQLAVGDLGRGVTVARKTLVFAEVETNPGGILDARPRRDLVHDQEIIITVRGSRPGPIHLVQCLKEVPELADDDFRCQHVGAAYQHADLSDQPPFPVRVQRTIAGVDCAESAGRCVLRSSENWPTFDEAWINLRFDPEADDGRTKFTVQPRRDLIHGQTLTIGSPDLAGVDFVYVSQCAVIDDQLAQGSCSPVGWFSDEPVEQSAELEPADLNTTNPEADSDLEILINRGPRLSLTTQAGSRTVDVQVRRYVGAVGADSLWDCASSRNGCVLLFQMASRAGYPMDHTAVLSFDPNGPSPEDTKVSVQPRRNLAKRQTVQIKIANALPGSVVVRQCARSSKTEVNQETCRLLDWSETKGLNKPSKLSVSVSRYLDNDNVDCAVAEFSCVIQVETGGEYYGSDDTHSQLTKLVAITFESGPPEEVIPPVTLRISPNTPLSDSSVVSVSGPAPADSQPLALVQCSLTADGGVATCNNETVAYLDAPSPEWEREITVVRRFTDSGEDVDCVETFCALVVFEFIDEVRPVGRSEYLTFDAFQALDTGATE